MLLRIGPREASELRAVECVLVELAQRRVLVAGQHRLGGERADEGHDPDVLVGGAKGEARVERSAPWAHDVRGDRQSGDEEERLLGAIRKDAPQLEAVLEPGQRGNLLDGTAELVVCRLHVPDGDDLALREESAHGNRLLLGGDHDDLRAHQSHTKAHVRASVGEPLRGTHAARGSSVIGRDLSSEAVDRAELVAQVLVAHAKAALAGQ